MEADYIGIDRGALQCVRQNIKMVMALGDFDSVSEEEFALIQNSCPVEDVIRLKMKRIASWL